VGRRRSGRNLGRETAAAIGVADIETDRSGTWRKIIVSDANIRID
jgi:hypothetical protein